MVELVDTRDLKSLDLMVVWVQVPLLLPLFTSTCFDYACRNHGCLQGFDPTSWD